MTPTLPLHDIGPQWGRSDALGKRRDAPAPLRFWVLGIVLALWANGSDAAALTRVELVGFEDRVEAQRIVGALDRVGIEAIVLPGSTKAGYAVSAGVFGQAGNVARMVERLRDLDYRNVRLVALEGVLEARDVGRDNDPAVSQPGPPAESVPGRTESPHGSQEGVPVSPDVAPSAPRTPGRLIIFGGPADSARNESEQGWPPGPVSPPDTPLAPAAGPQIKLDRLRAEAGLLPRSDARASGSHYLHGSASAEWPIGERWSASLSARVDGYVQTGDDDFTELDLDYGESHLRYRDSSRRVTLGAQTVLWGRVDEIPPTDQLSVQDATRYVLDDLEDRRRAVLAARWEEFVGEYKIDMLYVPTFRAAELPDEESIWSPVDRARGRIAGLPPNALLTPLVQGGRFGEDDDGRGGWGVRVSRASRGFDYALTLQDARRSLPYYELNPQVRTALVLDPSDVEGALASAPDTFIARHPRTWVVGGDVGFATEQAAWRFEAAWLSDQPATTGDFRFMELEALEWVAGADFFPGDGDLRVTLQLGGRHLLDAPGELLDRKDAFNVYGDVESRLARDRWIARLRFFQGLDERDTYLNPSLSFKGWEPHEFTLGYHYFDGSDTTLGGFYRDNDMVTLGWRAGY